MAEPLVRMVNVHKTYTRTGGGAQRLDGWLSALLGRPGNADGTPALHDISLHVARGESVGLIGDNGAGNSTLLKILAGVLRQSSGHVSVNGRVAALLELGAGFNQEFTGRENLALGAALMGVSANQLRRRLDDIIAFADLGGHLDRPLKHYSSGMAMRLGFALATTLEPDLLITDEVLAVGDESFQRKCNRWVDGYVAGGGTLLLVSHSMDQIRRLCRRTYWLKGGKIEQHGDTDEVVDAYLRYHERKGVLEPDADYAGAHYRLTRLEVNTHEGVLTDPESLIIEAELHSPDDRAPVVALGLKDRHNTAIYGLTSEMHGVTPRRLGRRRFGFTLALDVSQLLPGRYQVTGHAMDPEALRLFDTAIREFDLPEGDSAAGLAADDAASGFVRL
ncbi:MAG: polysaccharide ABC transporter ATP-binding protein [Pseudomonadota bacterium]